jgi:hypothetical protein
MNRIMATILGKSDARLLRAVARQRGNPSNRITDIVWAVGRKRSRRERKTVGGTFARGRLLLALSGLKPSAVSRLKSANMGTFRWNRNLLAKFDVPFDLKRKIISKAIWLGARRPHNRV